MKKISGYALILLGVLHTIVGICAGWAQTKLILQLGIWNALGIKEQALCMNDLTCLQINSTWWFISWGLMLILFGMICVWVEVFLNRSVPKFIGWFLFFISTTCAILIPASGFWLVSLVAIYMIVHSHFKKKESVDIK